MTKKASSRLGKKANAKETATDPPVLTTSPGGD